jgi:replication fork protection complex subunit Csm3/Swi3
LLSQAGIPKLRKRAKDLKLKGKGHEVGRVGGIGPNFTDCLQYSDAARLLQMYQLWLDDLFPKARFLDALAMVERLGHKRRIQMVRDQLINEGAPKSVHEESMYDEPQLSPRDDSDRRPVPTKVAPIFEKRVEERQKTPAPVEEMEEDLYNATPRAPRVEVTSQAPTAVESSIFGATKTTIEENPEDDLDELDALLAEQEMDLDKPAATDQKEAEPDFDDDMEAMAEMDDMW